MLTLKASFWIFSSIERLCPEVWQYNVIWQCNLTKFFFFISKQLQCCTARWLSLSPKLIHYFLALEDIITISYMYDVMVKWWHKIIIHHLLRKLLQLGTCYLRHWLISWEFKSTCRKSIERNLKIQELRFIWKVNSLYFSHWPLHYKKFRGEQFKDNRVH